MKTQVTIIGAGLSGLATAWYLVERGAYVRVLESSPHPGGLIRTVQTPEGLVETAARAFPWSAHTRAFFDAMGIRPEFARDSSKRRYIYRAGRPRRWPLGPVETAGMGARVGLAWAIRRMKPRGRESVADWGARVIGRPATTWLLGPALQGIYAAPPGELSASALFGKSRAPRGSMAAPHAGMGALITRIHDRLAERGVRFEFGRPATPADVDPSFSTLICTNAPAASALLAPHAPAFSEALARIRMVSIVIATAFFAPDDRDLRGFGVLFPRLSGIRALGAVFNTDVFSGRGALRSESWIYGDLDPSTLPGVDGDDAAVRAAITADRERLTGRTAAPMAVYVTRQIQALPVYDTAVLDAQALLPSLPPHITLAGNYLGRLGVSSLLLGAAEAARSVAGSRAIAVGKGNAA